MAISTIGTNGLDQTNNVELGATGNVGIGTANPTTKLEIDSSINAPAVLIKATTGTYTSGINFSNTGGTGTVGLTSSSGGGLITGGTAYALSLVSPSTPIQFSANNGSSVNAVIDTSGNLLVGTTSAGGTVTNAIINKVNSVSSIEYHQYFSATGGTTATSSIDVSALFGINTTPYFHIEVDAGCYGNAGTGAGVYKAVLGGYSSSSGTFSIATITNQMAANGSWVGLSNSGTTFSIGCTSTSNTKDGVVRWKITWK